MLPTMARASLVPSPSLACWPSASLRKPGGTGPASGAAAVRPAPAPG